MPKLSNKGVQLPFSPIIKLETYAENFCCFLLEYFNDSKQKIMLALAQGFYSTPRYGIDKIRFAFILITLKTN